MGDSEGLLAIHTILVHIFVMRYEEHDLVSFTSHLFKNIDSSQYWIVLNGGMILYAAERTQKKVMIA
jgi:hypothetical protein